VAKRSKSLASLPVNNTVKLTDNLRVRITNAMEAGGFSVWSEYCRVALTEKCQAIEGDLRTRDPSEYARIYGNGR
jgi:Arc/MetJ-type ribon-helix-helix transcriptional regulator